MPQQPTRVQWTARLLYEGGGNPVKPTWDQLGDTTRAVWYETAARKLAGHPRWWSAQPDNEKPGTAAALRYTLSELMKMNATQLTAIALALEDLANAFRAAGGDDAGGSGNGKAGKPVRGKTKPAPAAEEGGVDIDTVREKMKELVEAKGSDALLAAFAEVGAGKLADVDESQYQELIDAAQALIDAEDEPAPKTKPKTKPAGKAKKGPTLEEVNEAASALIEADKPAYLKLMKKLGKPSEMDEADYAAAIGAYEAAMPEAEESLL